MSWVQPGYKLFNEILDADFQLQNSCVADMVIATGTWNLEILQPLLPAAAIDKLHAVLPPSGDRGRDVCVWPDSSSGTFSVASAYSHLAMLTMTERLPKWEFIWKISAPERVRAFMWILFHGRILTNARKLKMGIGDGLCSHCNSVEETILHAMRDCPLARVLWSQLVPYDLRPAFYYGNLQHWVECNVYAAKTKVEDYLWGNIWAVACHSLWFWRNKERYDANFSRPCHPWRVVYQRVREYAQASLLLTESVGHIKRSIEIKWSVHHGACFFLNTDGAAKQGNSIAGCGGVLRDRHGNWIRGFAKFVGSCSAFIAELWGVLEGLRMAKEWGCTTLELQLDARVIVDLLQSDAVTRLNGWSLIVEIKKLLHPPWQVRISHIYREANRVADALASLGCNRSLDLCFYEQPPSHVEGLVQDDLQGISFPRLCLL